MGRCGVVERSESSLSWWADMTGEVGGDGAGGGVKHGQRGRYLTAARVETSRVDGGSGRKRSFGTNTFFGNSSAVRVS